MRTYKLLSIDETGKSSYSHPSKLFIVTGVVIPEKLKTKIDKETRKIKRKYFRDPEIVFHSRDMFRAKGKFAILRDEKIASQFWTDFFAVIANPAISVLFIVVDKSKAKKHGWQTKTILQRTYVRLLESFTDQLNISRDKGKIIVESDSYQDTFLIYAHSRLQSLGTSNKVTSGKEYQSLVTSLSLVNKENLDIDIQIADTLAPIAGLKYDIDVLNVATPRDYIKLMGMKLLEEKFKNKGNPSLFEPLL